MGWYNGLPENRDVSEWAGVSVSFGLVHPLRLNAVIHLRISACLRGLQLEKINKLHIKSPLDDKCVNDLCGNKSGLGGSKLAASSGDAVMKPRRDTF